MKIFHYSVSFILLCVFASSFAATQPINNTKRLSQISHQIAEARKNLKQTLAQQNVLQAKLKASEESIGSLSDGIRRINDNINKNNTRLKQLHSQELSYQTALTRQQNDLAKQVRVAYQTNRENYLKILFNQQNPYQLSRTMTYYQYFSRAHLSAIKQISQVLINAQQTQAAIKQNTLNLQKLLGRRIMQQQDLRQSREQRKQVLVKLNNQAETQHQRITRLEVNKRELEKVLHNLSVQQSRRPFVGGNFASMKRHLSWPTRGKITRRFGSRVNNDLRYNGVFISANEGQGIHAIAPGKVIFANWLKGFGLLLIIDHGNGYMTLYAHCNSLYKQVGDVVTPGEPIASVGNSGGEANVGLMFQIRHDSKALDPNRWCS